MSLRRRSFVENPVVHVGVGASILAIAFPRDAAGALGMLALVALASVAIARHWARLPEVVRRPPADFTRWLVIALVVMFGMSTFWETLTQSPDWQGGDWGIQRSALAHAMGGIPGLELPAWDHTLSTGDAPFDMYPAFAYRVVGHVAWVLGLEDDLPLAFMITAVLVHVGIAVGTTALAMRFAPRWVALVVGMFALVDSGAVAHGGTVGLFKWALLHSAMSLAFALIAAVGVVESLRKPRVSATVMIWLGTALATATHPAGLVGAGAACVGLLGVALFAGDVPPRRPLLAVVHVVIGLALAAFIWMPLASRILLYGQHFPNALHQPAQFLEQLLGAPTPVSAFAMLSYAGLFGLVAGLWSRQAVVVFVAATTLALFVGMTDLPYLTLDLAPGRGSARLGVERLAQLARPLLGAAAAYTIAILIRAAREPWKTASPRRKAIAAAAIGIMSVAMLRAFPDFWRSATTRATAEARVLASDKIGRDELVAWAQQRMLEMTPAKFGRVLFETDTHEMIHLTAETGIPSFHMGPIPDMLLRERIENTSEASLRRFNVRWIVGIGRTPTLGDPATEIELGRFHVRELAAWDGAFARIEAGDQAAKVVTTRLDPHGPVEIEVTGTALPVLVTLGTGYYPRWRATHASGADEPVYAHPTIPGGELHVVSAWVAPGKTTFTVDGELPSDGDGRLLSILALLVAAGGTVAWSRRAWRTRLVRRIALGRAKLSPRIGKPLGRFGAGAIVLLVGARGVLVHCGPARDVGVGSGIRALATVEAKIDGEWQDCAYSHTMGEYRCPGLVTIYDGTASILNDAAPSWSFVTSAINASIEDSCQVRIWMRANLDGAYRASVSSGTATLTVDGEAPVEVTRDRDLSYASVGDRTLRVEASIYDHGWAFAMVKKDTIIPDRPFLEPPPVVAPAAIRAIHLRR